MATTNPLTVDANTVALYHLDGTAGSAAKVDNAQGTSSRDLTENNAPTSVTGQITPQTDGAYDLNGSNQYLNTADDASFDGLSQFTLEFWINPDVLTDDLQPITKWGTSTANDMSWRTIFASSNISMNIGNGTTSGTIVPTGTISTGTWTYFAFTYNNSLSSGSRGKVYVNGADVTASDNTPSTMLAGTAQLLLGNRTGLPAGGYYNGKIDEIRISNTARSAASISAYYNSAPTSGNFFLFFQP